MPSARGLTFLMVRLLSVVLLSGCSFTTHNVARPLMVAGIPKNAPLGQIYQDLRPGVDFADFEESMDEVRSPTRFADIRRYAEASASRDFEDLLEALELYPDNPYAWFGLGFHLALQHRQHDSLAASSRVVDVLEAVLEDGRGLSRPLRELYQLTLLNQANYAFLDGDGEASLAALEQLDLLTERGVALLSLAEQVTLRRIRVQALVLLGRTEEAEQELNERLLSLAPELSDRFRDYRWEVNYPQIFDATKRSSVNHYLRGLIALSDDRSSEAVAALEESIALDPDRWEAHYSLAAAYARDDEGGVERGRRKLVDILETIDRREFYREDVLRFALAQLCTGAGDLDCAEEEYQRAISAFEAREAEVRSELEQALREHCGTYRPNAPPHHDRCRTEGSRFLEAARDPTYGIFSAAHVRLADVLRQRVGEGAPSDRTELLSRAESHYRWAVRNPRYSAPAEAYLGLVRTALSRLDEHAFFAASREVFGIDPGSVELVDLLVRLIVETDAVAREHSLSRDRLESRFVPIGACLLAEVARDLDLPPSLLDGIESRLGDLPPSPAVDRARRAIDATIQALSGEEGDPAISRATPCDLERWTGTSP